MNEPRVKKSKSSWALGIAFIGLIVALIVISARQGGGDDALVVRIETVARASLKSRVRAQGRVRAESQVTVTSEVSGRIAAVHVAEGDKVEKDAPLFTLQDDQYKTTVDTLRVARQTAQSVLARAELVLAEAERGLKRDSALRTKGLVSNEVFVASENRQKFAAADIEQARANVERTRLELNRARSTLSKTVIKSPIAGTVVDMSVRVGQVVGSFSAGAGDTSALGGLGGLGGESSVSNDVVIANLDGLIAEMRIDEIDVARVKPGQKATVRAQGDSKTEVEGAVRSVGLLGHGSREAVYFDTTLTLPAGAPLLSGMTVNAEIVVAERTDAVVVPVAALIDDEDGTSRAYVVEGTIQPVAKSRTLKLGPSDGDRVVIESGLKGGEALVVGPYRSLAELKDGSAVRIEEDTPDDKDKKKRSP